MPLYHKHKLIHVHIPKTGGTSIEGQLLDKANVQDQILNKSDKNMLCYVFDPIRKKSHQHYTFLEIIDSCKEKNINLDEYNSFAVVRNPFERAASDFHICNSNVLHKKYKMHNIQQIRMEFHLFLLEFLDPVSMAKFDWHAYPQYKYISDADGNSLDEIKILRFENLTEDFLNLGIGDLVIHTNESIRKHAYREYYTTETRDLILDYYKEDFIRFGYSTELEIESEIPI
jgi:hypothetical protein